MNENLYAYMTDKLHAYHQPPDDGLAKINRLRAHFSEGERLILEICPTSDHLRAVALIQNEIAAWEAMKAVVFNDPASEVTHES